MLLSFKWIPLLLTCSIRISYEYIFDYDPVHLNKCLAYPIDNFEYLVIIKTQESDIVKHPLFQQKIVKTSFKSKGIVSTSRPLELLHIDLFGPVSTASIYGSKYGLVIVDDYSRWSWVKFLKSKDDSYDVFSEFYIQIQSEKELKFLKVRRDHGGEFENEPFEIFCERHGIIH